MLHREAEGTPEVLSYLNSRELGILGTASKSSRPPLVGCGIMLCVNPKDNPGACFYHDAQSLGAPSHLHEDGIWTKEELQPTSKLSVTCSSHAPPDTRHLRCGLIQSWPHAQGRGDSPFDFQRFIKGVVRVIIRAAREFREALNYGDSIGWIIGEAPSHAFWEVAGGRWRFPMPEALRHQLRGLEFQSHGSRYLLCRVVTEREIYTYSWSKRPGGRPSPSMRRSTWRWRDAWSGHEVNPVDVSLQETGRLLMPHLQLLFDFQAPLHGALVRRGPEPVSETHARRDSLGSINYTDDTDSDEDSDSEGYRQTTTLLPASLDFVPRPASMFPMDVGACRSATTFRPNKRARVA